MGVPSALLLMYITPFSPFKLGRVKKYHRSALGYYLVCGCVAYHDRQLVVVVGARVKPVHEVHERLGVDICLVGLDDTPCDTFELVESHLLASLLDARHLKPCHPDNCDPERERHRDEQAPLVTDAPVFNQIP